MASIHKGNLKPILSLLIKASVILAAFAFIYYRINAETDTQKTIAYFTHVFAHSTHIEYLIIGVGLVLVNWGLEALKWRRLVNRFYPLTLSNAFQATLAGITASVFTPNRAGEFAGRMLYVPTKHRLKAILASFICSIGQLLITLTIGSIAFIAYLATYSDLQLDSKWISTLAFVVIALLIPTLFLFYRLSFLKGLLKPFTSRWHKLKQTLKLLNALSASDYSFVLFASLFRFVTYCIQFYVLLTFFESDIRLEKALVLIPVNFLGITAIPSVALAELGVREAVALSFMSAHSTSALAIVTATFSLWMINVAIPAILGTFFIAKARIFEGND